ncbi:AI-2E family transporter [Listeria monocytogenes]|uniref:AI-2E family transporter n=6 Tax=Listeria monocytogenes TaxID=1639 RepID=A0A0B8QYI9_LISMN|nr:MULTISPECIES: AI-2E family transporter [Listeria]EAC6519953.1 AI-2E family transporter [Listeria monocytogenes serotype 4b]EAE1679802.1 AI-2E family transporter [Listeria monocytogenes LIS0071]EAE3704239.1 AI-2E family transporter [Listeria monocytogenes serotype 1/2b]EAF4526923.1 AI-2E family transporter [Listeria monocytogenes serotype 1/2a]EAG6252274.1 AI-2E family transporter [Listeria monocytogenes CFSAN003806]EAG6261623.1 AI-2E family transporter [Listeria monocytogenes CFSAN003725]
MKGSFTKFKQFFIENKFVLGLLIFLLVALDIYVLTKIAFIFDPLMVILKTVAAPIILAGISYYLFNPIIDWLEKHKWKRGWAIALLYLVIIGLLILLFSFVIPAVKDQIVSLFKSFPGYWDQITQKFDEFSRSSLFDQIKDKLNTNMSDIMKTLSTKGTSVINSAISSIGSIVGTVTEVVLAIVTTPLVLFYLLKDGKKLPDFLLKMLPVNGRAHTRQVLGEANHQISSYIRGQIIVSLCIGILLFIGYLIIGLPYALTLAIIAACTSIVPYLGPAIAITPAIIIAIVTSPWLLIKLIIVWCVVQLLEGKFISPQVMGKTLKVHPITILFVILVAGNLFGVLGVIFAVPGYAVLKVIVTHVFIWFKRISGLYGEQPESEYVESPTEEKEL